jgi:hypothetical protein
LALLLLIIKYKFKRGFFMKSIFLCLALFSSMNVLAESEKIEPSAENLLGDGIINGTLFAGGSGSGYINYTEAKAQKKGMVLNRYELNRGNALDGTIDSISRDLKPGDQAFHWTKRHPKDKLEKEMIAKRIETLESEIPKLMETKNRLQGWLFANKSFVLSRGSYFDVNHYWRTKEIAEKNLKLIAEKELELQGLKNNMIPVDLTEVNKILNSKGLSRKEMQEQLRLALKAEVNKGRDLVRLGVYSPKTYLTHMGRAAAGSAVAAVGLYGLANAVKGLLHSPSNGNLIRARLDGSERGSSKKEIVSDSIDNSSEGTRASHK